MNTIECFCCWYDLLGFGNEYEENGWTVESQNNLKNFSRLRTFNEISSYNGLPSCEVIFTLNDGCARTYDLFDIYRTPQLIGRWLTSVIDSFNKINQIDVERGHPGLRGVITYGNRLNFEHENVYLIDKTIGHPDDRKRLERTIHSYSPRQLQLNLAFSKAYFMESMGSRAGVKGNHLFIDNFFLDKIIDLASKEYTETYFGDPIEEEPNKFTIPMSDVVFFYRTEMIIEGNEEVLLIYRKSNLHQEIVIFGFRFELEPIPFNFRGLSTTLKKLKGFYPIDHNYPTLIDLSTDN